MAGSPILLSAVGTTRSVWRNVISVVDLTRSGSTPISKEYDDFPLSVKGTLQDQVDGHGAHSGEVRRPCRGITFGECANRIRRDLSNVNPIFTPGCGLRSASPADPTSSQCRTAFAWYRLTSNTFRSRPDPSVALVHGIQATRSDKFFSTHDLLDRHNSTTCFCGQKTFGLGRF